MFALREYVGEARVNGALRTMMEEYGTGQPPLPTSLDLYRELQAVTPREQQGLLHDLFAANTYWELKTKRATVEPAEGGAWRVSLDVVTRKVVVDEVGHLTEVPMDEPVELGVYAAAEGEGQGEPPERVSKDSRDTSRHDTRGLRVGVPHRGRRCLGPGTRLLSLSADEVARTKWLTPSKRTPCPWTTCPCHFHGARAEKYSAGAPERFTRHR